MDTNKSRIEIAKILGEALKRRELKQNLSRFFMHRLSEIDPDLCYPSRISDRTLNAAWNFADYYFDAVDHDFEDCGGIPLDKATEKLTRIISVLEQGLEISDPDVLRFYYKPNEWRLKRRFPRISHQ